mgnify:CR=1 FL=1
MSSPSADAVNARIDSWALQGTVVAAATATTAAQPPAGGTGATAGAYDTAGNRDAMIAALNNLRIDFDALYTRVNTIATVLQANKLIP